MGMRCRIGSGRNRSCGDGLPKQRRERGCGFRVKLNPKRKPPGGFPEGSAIWLRLHHGSNSPLMTFVVLTLPFGSKTVMF